METFSGLKALTDNPSFKKKRERQIKALDEDTIDAPIVGIIKKFLLLSQCFTLQSCYGHFLYGHQKDSKNTEPLPPLNSLVKIEYRVAYIAICIDNSMEGIDLFNNLKRMQNIDPGYVQFGCAGWFWEKTINSYVLQVEPEELKTRDRIVVEYNEALHIEKIRNMFFVELNELLKKLLTQRD